MSKGGQIQPGGGGPRGDFGDPVYDAGDNGTMLGGLPPSLYNGLNQMPTAYDYIGPPTPMMPQPGAINDPTVNAALAVLNRSQPSNQMPGLMPGLMPMMMPAMRGSGVSDQVRQYNFGLVPETPYQTATYLTPAAPVDSGAGSDSGGMDVGVDNGFSSLSPSDQAAYYAENPTMGSIGRVVNSVVENSLPGQVIGYFDPGAFTTNDAIMAGMDPTGWQFAERESDGLMGTQIGGTLSFPELSAENFGPYAFPESAPDPYADTFLNTPEAEAWANTPAVAPVMTDGLISTPDVVSASNFMAEVANQSDDPMAALMDQLSTPVAAAETAPATLANTTVDLSSGPVADASGSSYGGVVTDGSGRAVTTSDGSAVSFGDGGVNAGDGGYGSGTAGYDAGDMGHGGGEGGGDSPKIICTAMNQAYGFGSFRNAIWIAYADKHLSKAHEVGYHALFLPLVDYAFKRGDGKLNLAVRKVLEWGTRHRSTDLRAEMRGTKRDTTGRIIRFIFEPLCYAAGKLKGY